MELERLPVTGAPALSGLQGTLCLCMKHPAQLWAQTEFCFGFLNKQHILHRADDRSFIFFKVCQTRCFGCFLLLLGVGVGVATVRSS